MNFEQSIKSFSGQPLTRQVLLDLLKGYKRPQDKISELVREQKLVPVRRGLFVPGPQLDIMAPASFLVANQVAGPSYVSMETALSHWNLIPELVYEIASMTTGRSTIYDSPAGRFSYTHLPLPYYSFGQRQLELAENQVALIAGPEKALCDKIVATSALLFRSVVQLKDWLIQDMRMDREILRTLDTDLIHSWLKNAPKKTSLKLLIKILNEL